MKYLFLLGAAVSSVAGSCEYGTPSGDEFPMAGKPDLSFNSTDAAAVLEKSSVTVNVERKGSKYALSYSVAMTSDAGGKITPSFDGNTVDVKFTADVSFSGASRTPATMLPCVFLPAVLPESLYLPGLASCLMVANVASADADDCAQKFNVVINVTLPVTDRSAISVPKGVTANGAAEAPTTSPATQGPSVAPTASTSSPVTVTPTVSASPTIITASPTSAPTGAPTTTTAVPTVTTSAPTSTTVAPTATTVAPTKTTAAPTAAPTATTAAPVSVAPTTTTSSPVTVAPTTTTSTPTTTTSAPTTTTSAPTTTTSAPTTTTSAPTSTPTTTTEAPTISVCTKIDGSDVDANYAGDINNAPCNCNGATCNGNSETCTYDTPDCS